LKQRELVATRRKLEKPYFGDDAYEENQAGLAEMEQRNQEQSPEQEIDDSTDTQDQQVSGIQQRRRSVCNRMMQTVDTSLVHSMAQG
jgi:phosphoserine aminotransferase